VPLAAPSSSSASRPPLELLLLAFILRAAWTWPRTIRATAGRDLAQARV
jgi:hypothetical protein